MFTVYVLQCSITKKIYIGQTNDINKRLKQHRDKTFDKKSYTKLRGKDWKLIYKEEFGTRKEALKREKILKSHKGRDWIRSVLLGP